MAWLWDLCSETFFLLGFKIFCAIHNPELVSQELCQYSTADNELQQLFTRIVLPDKPSKQNIKWSWENIKLILPFARIWILFVHSLLYNPSVAIILCVNLATVESEAHSD